MLTRQSQLLRCGVLLTVTIFNIDERRITIEQAFVLDWILSVEEEVVMYKRSRSRKLAIVYTLAR